MTQPRKRGGSSLDSGSLRALLEFLHPDPHTASEHYQSLHHRLTRLLEWRGARYPEELADEVMNRMARRLAEGLDVRVPDPYKYLSGIAYRVLQEEYREAERSSRVLQEASRFIKQTQETDEEQDLKERTMGCLESCIQRLPPTNRELVLNYYRTAGKKLYRNRKQLAESSGITAQALRLRVLRIRVGLERCVAGCMAGETPTRSTSAEGRRVRTP